MRHYLLVAVLAMAPVGAHADSPMSIGLGLGPVIGSEKFCDLTYDQAAISAYIEQHVPATSTEFIRILDTAIWAANRDNENMTESAKTARCAHIRRFAKANGFIK